jgi:hypothetical protein
MSTKLKFEFDGFDELTKRLNSLGGNVKKTAEKALKECHRQVTSDALQAIKPHKDTGVTEKSLYTEGVVEWTGTQASIPVGFSISKGGIASIMLMYGTPKIPKDQNLYNALSPKSKKLENKVKQIQEDIFYEEIRRLNG